jgi:hypothetical protein
MPTLVAPTTPLESYFDKGDIIIHVGHAFGRPTSIVEILDWTNKNSNSPVKVENIKVIEKDGKWVGSDFGSYRLFFAFKSSDDALFFRIKYGSL